MFMSLHWVMGTVQGQLEGTFVCVLITGFPIGANGATRAAVKPSLHSPESRP